MKLELFTNMPTIHFFLRNEIIYCRVRLNESVSEFSTKEKIILSYWNQSLQLYKSKDKVQNKYIETLLHSISYKLKMKAISLPSLITAKQLINEFQNKESKVFLTTIIDQYINNCNNSTGTIKNHRIKLKNLLEFQGKKNEKFTTETFTQKQCNAYIEWFTSTRNTNNITSANRNILFFRMALIWYRKQGNKVESELFSFVAEKDKVKPAIFLTTNELKVLQETTFVSEYLTRIKDLFLFQCFTGLSYCDLWNDWEIKHLDYGIIIQGNRGKNGQKFWLPVDNNLVLEILEKYNNRLPQYENAVYNRVLKEIAAICGIEKKITTHTARKTFATLMDAQGWTRETVSKMLGHKSVKTTELYYIGESFERLEQEMIKRKINII